MRKELLMFFVFFLLSNLKTKADGISVAGFKLLETDLTANTYGTQKMDQNGEKAALIRIVTTERGFTFEGGSLGIVGTEEKNGEIWLYVPRHAQKLTIRHQSFGVLRDYFYPISIQGGRTYEMLLDIGIGRYVSITTSQAKADVSIDGEYIGKSPIFSRYLSYGKHSVVAQYEMFEGSETINIVPTDDAKGRIVAIEMSDMSSHYGEVTVKVDNDAEIYFKDRKVGAGSWTTQLREGNYLVETRKADCEPTKTAFIVEAQKKKEVKATSPAPYSGYLSIYTRPSNVIASYNGTRRTDLQEPFLLPIGTYQVEYSKKGYVSENREYTIGRNETITDTITLQHVTYVKPLAFYFGGAYTARGLSGITGILGMVYQHHDLQLSYTFGLTESDAVYWGGDKNTGTKYKMQSIGVKYGYQIPLMRQLAITPQIGYYYNSLSASASAAGNTIYGDGASSQTLSIGAKLIFVPIQHLYLFVVPEYMFALSKDNNFKTITDSSNFSGDGFAVHAGLLVSF